MILIVDENGEGREGLRRLLSRVGYRVECAADGADAVAYLSMVRPRVIILTLTPDPTATGGGLDLLRAIRENPRTADLPVVALAERDDPALEHEATRLGLSGYLHRGEADFIGLLSRVSQVCEPALPPVPALRAGGG